MIGGYDIPVGADTFKTRKAYEPDRNLISSISNLWNSTAISTYSYGNDAIGRRTNRIDSGASVATNAFGYNTRSELIDADMGTNDYDYVYDPIGNRQSYTNNGEAWSYLANELNQYTNVADGVTNAPTYDDDGNMLTYGGWTYTWNGENRLVNASNASTVVTFGYDYMGRRFKKTVGSTTNRFLYDGWAMIRESKVNGLESNVCSYVYGLDLSGSMQGAGTIGGLLSANLDAVTVFYCYDANGNVTELVNTNGSNVATYVYGPFGGTVASSGTLVGENPFRFSQKYLDDSTGWYYYGFRYYDPELGRWPSRDPIGENGGLNRYAFAANSAIAQIDPIGLSLISPGAPSLPSPGKIAKCLGKCLIDLIDDQYELIIDNALICNKIKGRCEKDLQLPDIEDLFPDELNPGTKKWVKCLKKVVKCLGLIGEFDIEIRATFDATKSGELTCNSEEQSLDYSYTSNIKVVLVPGEIVIKEYSKTENKSCAVQSPAYCVCCTALGL